MKICSKCRELKDICDFGKRSTNKDGLNYYCKLCEKIKSKGYREANRERCNLSAVKSRDNLHWSVRLYRGTQSSANTRELEHSITLEDIQSLWLSQEGKCYWLGVALSEGNLPNRHPLKPSLDRLDNSKGYIKDNVVITSTFANLGRSNTTTEDFSEFLNILKQEIYNGNSSHSGHD